MSIQALIPSERELACNALALSLDGNPRHMVTLTEFFAMHDYAAKAIFNLSDEDYIRCVFRAKAIDLFQKEKGNVGAEWGGVQGEPTPKTWKEEFETFDAEGRVTVTSKPFRISGQPGSYGEPEDIVTVDGTVVGHRRQMLPSWNGMDPDEVMKDVRRLYEAFGAYVKPNRIVVSPEMDQLLSRSHFFDTSDVYRSIDYTVSVGAEGVPGYGYKKQPKYRSKKLPLNAIERRRSAQNAAKKARKRNK